ncbi:hypothetical protein FOA52_005993 [Chlamydomonas sp. UWO 241]|nr:hypothetical protein FOA52_005993 [Chlamydomonas sp. UWO 241]
MEILDRRKQSLDIVCAKLADLRALRELQEQLSLQADEARLADDDHVRRRCVIKKLALFDEQAEAARVAITHCVVSDTDYSDTIGAVIMRNLRWLSGASLK